MEFDKTDTWNEKLALEFTRDHIFDAALLERLSIYVQFDFTNVNTAQESGDHLIITHILDALIDLTISMRIKLKV
jgi:hypothetical protein